MLPHSPLVSPWLLHDAYGHDSYGENKASSSTPHVKYTSLLRLWWLRRWKHKTSWFSAPSKANFHRQAGLHCHLPLVTARSLWTVTSQYQPYPTPSMLLALDGKGCDKWNEGQVCLTVINDCESKKTTVTSVEKPITVYHTKTTVTTTPPPLLRGGRDGKAHPLAATTAMTTRRTQLPLGASVL